MPTSLQSRARVVIGDDNDTTLQTISRIVRVQFDVVDTVRDGETAINSIELLKPDVLVLDVFLPPLDGIQVVRRLKTLVHRLRS
jgi:CheY-like chemotaxis protein